MGLSSFITTSDRTTTISSEFIEAQLQALWDSVGPMPHYIYVDKDRFKRMKQMVRSWEAKHHGVVIRGCKGKRVVRMRNERWQVVQ